MEQDECPYRSEFARRHYFRGYTEGLARGTSNALQSLLRLRGFTITEVAATRMDMCTDLSQLDTWLDRAVTADAIDDVFAD
ncbi:hypothetical protein ACWEO2_37075 [Nocardia sp. NPDC004278]